MSDSWRQVTVPATRLPGWLDRFTARHGEPVASLDTGTVVLTCPDLAVARLRLRWALVDLDDPLAALVATAQQPRRLGLLLVRRGRHAVGIWDQGLVWSRTARHYVQGRTKAGGWSQQRYARRREQQARHAFGKAAADAATLLEPEVSRLDAVVLAGDPAGLEAVLADRRCAGLAALARSRPTDRVEVREPSRDALVDVVEQYNAVLVELNQHA